MTLDRFTDHNYVKYSGLIVTALSAIYLLFGGLKDMVKTGEWEQKRREVAWKIDSNKDCVYTDAEWSRVYQSLGLNDTRKQGTDISTKAFNDFLSKK